MPSTGRYELLPGDPEPGEKVKVSQNFSISRVLSCLKIVLGCVFVVLTAFLLWNTLPSQLNYVSRDRYGRPLATVANGSIRGYYLPKWDQDVFLGIPYAASPVGPLRFRRPQPAEAWEGVREAVKYAPQCMGYGEFNLRFEMSEDCLFVDVVRPAGYEGQKLPVGVYMYGGGREGSGTSNERYNLTFIVAHAAEVGLPFIGVSFNFRSSLWGFIASQEVHGTGNSNLGLQDQRLGLRWIQENIAAFGGDPRKVTIWGGSAGAENVGFHLTANGGRDEGLFRAAILQSGTPVTRTDYVGVVAQELYSNLVESTGCKGTEDSLDCLRNLPFETLNNAFNDSIDVSSPMMMRFGIPTLDGSLLSQFGSVNLKEQKMIKVPVLTGVSLNEGSTWLPSGVKNWEDFREYLVGSSYRHHPPAVVDKLLSFYPEGIDDEALDPPIKEMASKDLLRRVEQVLGDIEHNAAQRLLCQSFTQSSKCYSYIFSGMPARKVDPRLGTTHGAEIGPLFQNSEGLGLGDRKNPFEGKGPDFHEMSRLMGTMWAGFITSLDPNAAVRDPQLHWPQYSFDEPKVYIFREDMPGSVAEGPQNRIQARDYINSIQHSVFGK